MYTLFYFYVDTPEGSVLFI